MTITRAPGLGPLVGHTTESSCRLWIRAGDPADDGAQLSDIRRTIGVIGLVGKQRGQSTIIKGYYFRLHREFDRTGTFNLGEDVALGRHPLDIKARRKALPGKSAPAADKPYRLKPNTEYTVRMGTLTLDDPIGDADAIPDWKLAEVLPPVDKIAEQLLTLPAERTEAVFRTFPSAETISPQLSFLLGSCRYPGLLWKVKEADRIYGPMQAHLEPNGAGNAARFSLMVGDQIYADVLNRHVPLRRADTYQEFQDRYIEAFDAPNLRRLLRSSTTYMILDDHEIEDNWTQDRLKECGKSHLFNVAISAYMSYQWSHGPRTWGRHLHYLFDCGGYPFFVLDTRTQRFKDAASGLRDNHMLGRPHIDPAHPSQLQKLLTWLVDQQKNRGDAPKFIVSSCVFAPNPIDERVGPSPQTAVSEQADPSVLLYEANGKRRESSDSWPGYPRTRLELLECVVENGVQNVIFLSGDVHCSNIARLWFEDGDGKDIGIKLYSVTSSAFYWPFPFADGDPNAYVHDSKAPDQLDPFPVGKLMLHYKSFGYSQEDNFCRLDVDRKKSALTVQVFDRNGEAVKVADETGKKITRSVLQLAPY